MTQRDAIRETGLIAYLLYGLSIVVSPAVLAGIIFVYLKHDAVRGSYVDSHMTWLARTFWWSLAGTVVGMVLTVILIGFVIMGLVWLWFVYRVVKGFVAFNDGQPINDPQAFF